MMKTYRSLSVFLIAVMLVGLCACGSKEGNAKGNGYKKEVDTYTHKKDDATISFEIAKELGYQEKTSDTNTLELENQESDTLIEIVYFHENSKSSTVVREADYYGEGFSDFEHITIGDYKGSKVFRDWGKADEIHECEIRLVLTEPSDKNMVYAVKVNFRKGLQCEDLDVKEFVDSEDYMHFLSSFKATLEDSEEETK